MDIPPPGASSKVEGASAKWPSSRRVATRTHFLGWEIRITLDRSFEYCLRIRGSETKRALDAKNIVRLHIDSSWLHFC
ncbi:hypothetical protein D5086_017422 [Populus alba]|uniref:Uncharacterized protein n=1 Tax=Populus alba TaxID=43335 RepID=A0ACC4BXB8_POPAL